MIKQDPKVKDIYDAIELVNHIMSNAKLDEEMENEMVCLSGYLNALSKQDSFEISDSKLWEEIKAITKPLEEKHHF